MRTFLMVGLVVAAFAVNGFGQKCKEYSPAGSSFAFCPPEGWVGTLKDGDKYVSYDAPLPKTEIGGHLTVSEDKVTEGRDELAFGLVKSYLQGPKFTNKRLIMAGDLETLSGLKGTFIVFYLTENGLDFAQAYYIVEGPKSAKYTFILTTAQNRPEVAKIGEAAIMTVRVK